MKANKEELNILNLFMYKLSDLGLSKEERISCLLSILEFDNYRVILN